jgi:hypothetical protein
MRRLMFFNSASRTYSSHNKQWTTSEPAGTAGELGPRNTLDNASSATSGQPGSHKCNTLSLAAS